MVFTDLAVSRNVAYHVSLSRKARGWACRPPFQAGIRPRYADCDPHRNQVRSNVALSLLPRSRTAHSAVTAALQDCRKAFWSLALFSGVVNLLMLAGPLY